MSIKMATTNVKFRVQSDILYAFYHQTSKYEMTAETTAHNSYYLHSHSLNENIWYIYTHEKYQKFNY